MPIKFRCAYCSQLMSIARRKAGAVVVCPQCQCQLIVPHVPADPDPSPLPMPRPNVFERQDFDPAVFDPGPPNRPVPLSQPPAMLTRDGNDGNAGPDTLPQPAELEVIAIATPSKKRRLVLGVCALLFTALGFAVGFIVARLM